MSLITEDGTVVVGAESYATVADTTAWHLARGNSTWAGLTNDQMEQALRRATDYMTQAYQPRWKGYRASATQELDWPRAGVYIAPLAYTLAGTSFLVTDTSVPPEVKNACIALALRAAAGDLLSDLSQGVLSEKIGPIETTYNKVTSQRVRYAAIDAMLAPYLQSSGIKVVRA